MPSVSESIRSAGISSIPWIPPEAAVRSPSIGLRCPVCKEFLIAISYRSLGRGNSSAHCTSCGSSFDQNQGIWQGLPESRAAHYARFIETAERRGLAVGRGSGDPDYYLALPFRDRGQREARFWAFRAKTFHCLQEEILSEMEARHDTPPTILDLGAGNGWMSYRLACSGYRPLALDLLANSRNGLGAASHYRSELPELFPRFQAEFDNLPFADGQFDCAIFNASFHYSEDFDRTIAEAVRCLRPGGVLIIADSPTYSVEAETSRWQQKTIVDDPDEAGPGAEGLAVHGYLTAQRLIALEVRHEFEWSRRRCWHGFRSAIRTWMAKWRKQAEFPEFFLYSTRVKTR